MSVRTNLGTCLIFATIFAAANSANGQDQALARASSTMDGCVRYECRRPGEPFGQDC